MKCLGNTGGWNCHQCLEGFYGNPLSGQCKACDCNRYGALSKDCDPVTGQCLCKQKYIGRTCSQCKGGFGNVAAGCRRCGCNPMGSKSEGCDADSGQCDCHFGITGITCDKCLPLHYGYGSQISATTSPGCQGKKNSEVRLSIGR